MRQGERQVAPNLSGIRADHRARYAWACDVLEPRCRVIDVACGVGYGAFIMARAGFKVLAIDCDVEAVLYGKEHYGHENIEWLVADVAEGLELSPDDFGGITCFETIEHLEDPAPLLLDLRRCAPDADFLVSVPNEAVFPYRDYAFHYRHYTKPELEHLLAQTGWMPVLWRGQDGPESPVTQTLQGRTLVASCIRTKLPVVGDTPAAPASVPTRVGGDGPRHVAIVGLGPSSVAFFEMVKALGGASGYCDEVWGINAIGDTLSCDRVFHMDDVAVQEMRALERPDSNIAVMVEWLKLVKGPVYTSVVRPGYPGMVAFPLEEVMNAGLDSGGTPYFNSTTAYAIAYAIHIGVEHISLFGVDYTQPNAHAGERGRACCEYWLGIAAARGIAISVPDGSTLLDACAPDRERLYGYDMVDVAMTALPQGGFSVAMTPRTDPPTAAQVEAAYNHKAHPNRLLAGHVKGD